jgi:hypothetical protein
VQQSPSSEAKSSAVRQDIHRTLWNPKVQYRVQSCPPLTSILSQMIPVNKFSTYFFRVLFHTVACLLKSRIVKPAETTVARERLCKHACCHTMAVTDMHATTEELLEAVFSLWSVPRLYNEGQLPLRVGGWCEMIASLGVSSI